MENKRLIILLSVAAALLSVPFVAMQFTSEVDWSLSDFVIMGIMLFGTALICELVLRKVKSFRNRALICAAVLLVFFFIWAELAVGLIGSPFAGS